MTVPSDIEQQSKDTKMTDSVSIPKHSEKSNVTASTDQSSKAGSKGSKSSIVMLPVDESVIQMVREHMGEEPEEDPERTTKTSSTKASRAVLPVESSVVDMVMASGLDNEVEEDPDRRKTKLYCGVCCDIRQACIVQLLLYLCWMVSSLNFNYGLYKDALALVDESTFDDDDDGMLEESVIFASSEADRMFLLVIKNATAVPFIAIGLYGSFRFNKYLALTAGIWCCVDVIWGCVLQRPVMIILVFTIYPLFALFEAIHTGKMTPENYRRTEKHCCCVKK